MNGIKELAAKIRNVFCVSDFQKRDGEGITQVKTHNGHVLEGAEAFPYGFIAKAKSGKAFVLCQGGNLDGFTILPVLISPDVKPPELEEGDTALFTGEGGRIVLRENGDVEITAKGEGAASIKTEKGVAAVKKDGKIYLGNDGSDICAVITGLIDKIKSLATTGNPAAQTINAASQQALEAYKNEVKKLFAEDE